MPQTISVFYIVLTLVSLLGLSFFFSLSEVAFVSCSEERIYKLKLDGSVKAKLAYELLEKKENVISVCSLADHTVNTLASSVMTLFLMRSEYIHSRASLLFLFSFLMSMFIFIFTESVPKILAIKKADAIVLQFSGILNLMNKLISPVFYLIDKLNRLIVKILNIKKEQSDSSEASQSIIGAVEMYYKKGAIIHEYRDMLNSILSLDKYDVSHVMTHKSDTYSIRINENAEEVYNKVINSKYSKIPIFNEKYDQVLGILKVVDFLRNVENKTIKINENNKYNLDTILIKPYFIPEGASLKSQLPKFKDNGSNMGVVIDEYGEVIGFVTIEDILEHIVGDIKDTNDSDTEIIKITEGKYIIYGELPIIEFNKRLNAKLSDGQFSTISGFITNYLERIPNQGEEFEINNFIFKVIKKKNNKIERLEVIKIEHKNE